MDLLKDAAKNLNLYEVKAYVRKAQNVAMNLTETESRVREATNNEPWGASTTLMSQIAAGTYNYREREEIVGFIFRRFTEKAANEWRQIYKSLQLLEYLVKNGSERIIDDIRGNSPLISMLKSFHYIDSKGRDQGINVRNRAKALTELLKDDALIRSERKKARANAKKFGGVSSAAYGGASSLGAEGGSSHDDDYTNRVFGDGGVYGARFGDTAESYNTPSRSASADADGEWEDLEGKAPAGSSKPTTSSSKVNAKVSKAKPQPKVPEPDLLGDLVDFNKPTQKGASAQNDNDDDDDFDDFDEFQAAPSQTTSQPLTNNLASLYQSSQSQAQFQQQQQQQHQQQQQQQQSSFQSFATQSQPSFNTSSAANYNVNTSKPSMGSAKASNNDAFSSLFSSAKTKTKTTPSVTSPKVGKNNTLDDDFFSTPTTHTSNGNSSNTNNGNSNSNSNNNNSGEIDLLSF